MWTPEGRELSYSHLHLSCGALPRMEWEHHYSLSELMKSMPDGDFQMDQKEVCLLFLSWEDLASSSDDTIWRWKWVVRECEKVSFCPQTHRVQSLSPPTPSSLTLWSAEASHKQLAHVGDWTWVGCEAWGDPSKKDHCQVLFNSHSMASCWKQRINPHMFSFLFHACAGWISWGCRPSRDSTWLLLSRLQPWHDLEIFDLEQEESFLPGHQLHPSWAFLAELLWELSFPLLGSL